MRFTTFITTLFLSSAALVAAQYYGPSDDSGLYAREADYDDLDLYAREADYDDLELDLHARDADYDDLLEIYAREAEAEAEAEADAYAD